jgi:hypothetical protein
VSAAQNFKTLVQDFETIGIGNWTMRVPKDWVVTDESSAGVLHLESGNGAKAISVSTWNLGGGAMRPGAEIAEAFKQAELKSLREMAGYTWQLMAEESLQAGALSIVFTDNWDPANNYRIAGLVMARPPLVVRATFHDYACVDYPASGRYFAPIIDSLEFRPDTRS